MKIDKKVFVDMLGYVRHSVSTNGIVDEYGAVRLSMDGDRLFLTTYNGVSYLHISGVCDESDGLSDAVYVPFQYLYDVCKSLSAERLTLSVSDNQLTLQGGRSKYKFGLVNGTFDYPSDMVDSMTSYLLPPNFGDFIGMVEHSIHPDASRPHFSCAYIHNDSLIGVDGISLSIVKWGVPVTETPINIPRHGVDILRKLPAATYRCVSGDGYVGFISDEGGAFLTQSHDVEMPSYQAMQDNFRVTYSCRVDVVAFRDAVSRAVMLAKKMEFTPVSLTFKGGKLLISSFTGDKTSSGYEVVDIEDSSDEEEYSVDVSGVRLTNHLKTLATDGLITISLGDDTAVQFESESVTQMLSTIVR